MGMESQPAGAPAPAPTGCSREEVERLVEDDLSLVPAAPSALLVEPSVLDPEEVRALLADLGALLAGEKDNRGETQGKNCGAEFPQTGGTFRPGTNTPP